MNCVCFSLKLPRTAVVRCTAEMRKLLYSVENNTNRGDSAAGGHGSVDTEVFSALSNKHNSFDIDSHCYSLTEKKKKKPFFSLKVFRKIIKKRNSLAPAAVLLGGSPFVYRDVNQPSV